MNNFLLSVIMLSAAGNSAALADGKDSLQIENLQEVVVKGVKAQKDAPFAVHEINREQLQKYSRTGRELPFLFAMTPGVTAWSENGVGTGTSHLRIRGAADSRINVTVDGVQLNSPEDECVFWANMNSYASLLGNVQIQRGVGTSTNGDGAFGGNVALTTRTPSTLPTLELSGSYGSYNTFNAGGNFSTGLLWNHLILDGAYHHTATDGFIDGTAGKSGSYYGGLSWLGKNFVIRYKNIGNYENTGQAWNGVTAGNGDYSMNAYDGIQSYKDMWDAGMGKFNDLYESFTPNWDGTWVISRHKMSDGTLWENTTDNFWQDHNILSTAVDITPHWSTTASLHYTYGYGYYEEFRYNNKLKKFGLPNFTLADGSTLKKTDFIRKKGLEQNTYGLVWNANYKDDLWDVIGGLSLQHFTASHFGYLTYMANQELSQHYMKDGRYTYYDSDADKGDGNVFVKATFHIDSKWDVFADLQYRHVEYYTDGINDKFLSNGDGTYSNQRLNVNEVYDFFNPKAGVSFRSGGHHAYASAALSHREPERNNFTDNGSYPAPKPEELTDVEIGYSYTAGNWNVGLNGYYMDYKNQFVQTGEVSDIGESLTTNVKDSYRLGVEISAAWQPLKWLTVYGNAALSQNKIKDFDEVVETYDDDWNDLDPTTNHYDNSTLAFSPAAILNGFVTLNWRGLQATWHTDFVSRQYLDNTECTQRSLPAYSQSDISADYTFRFRHAGIKELLLGVDINNVFDAHYAAGGWVYSAIVGSNYPNSNRYCQIGYMPMAGRNIMGNITLKF
jgi:iron complex outermembrane recepter protein